MCRRWLGTASQHWIWFLVCVQGRQCQTWQGFGRAEYSSGPLLLRRGMMLASSFPQSSSHCLVGRDKVRALTSNCSQRCNLRWLAEMFTFRCFASVCVCAFCFFSQCDCSLYLDDKLTRKLRLLKSHFLMHSVCVQGTARSSCVRVLQQIKEISASSLNSFKPGSVVNLRALILEKKALWSLAGWLLITIIFKQSIPIQSSF